MNDLEFNDNIDGLFAAIEDAIDEMDGDIDCEIGGGVLTLACPDGSSLIFSRQRPTHQLWLAAPSGGFHYAWQDEQWRCTRGGPSLLAKLAELGQVHLGEALVPANS